MRVAHTNNPRFSQYISWRLPWWARRDRDRGWIKGAGYPKDYEPPDFWDYHDFDDLPESDHGWREIDTWAVGGLGLFARETEPLPPVIGNGHRTGLEFENESDYMAPEAIPLLNEFFGGTTVHTEFPYGWTESSYSRGDGGKGLTDVVVCAYDWGLYAKRQQIVGDATLNDKWGYLKSYRWIENRGPVTAGGWLEKGPYSEDYLKEIWSYLIDNGFLATNGVFGGYHTTMPLPDHFEAVHAIELKQSNWREALEQAERALYADYRWVALDAGHMKAAREHADAFEEAGVGLLAIAKGGLVQLVAAEEQYPEPDKLDRVDLRERSVQELRPEVEPDHPHEDPTPEQAALDGFG